MASVLKRWPISGSPNGYSKQVRNAIPVTP